MYQCSKKLVTYKEYSCFDHPDFLAHSMVTFDVCWGSLGTSIFGNSSSAANNTRSRLPSRLSFRLLWLWYKEIDIVKRCYRTNIDKGNKKLTKVLVLPAEMASLVMLNHLWLELLIDRFTKIMPKRLIQKLTINYLVTFLLLIMW